MATVYLGGIEGGGTASTALIMKSSGEVVGHAAGPATNHYLCGMVEARKRIADLINIAKEQAGIPADNPLAALGLSLSGCEDEETNKVFLKGIFEEYPNLSEKIVVTSDTDGSVAATSNAGGIVCIAGTGSNTLLINPDGTRVQCGGWGNLLGDEGSAYNIAHSAIKYCFDEIDNFQKAPYPIDRVWELIKCHFEVEKQVDLLSFFYTKFDKAFVASMTKKISELARDGDKLSEELFRQAGVHLAKAISAVVLKADSQLTDREGGIHITCVGSVWLSWDLLKPGFLEIFNKQDNIADLTLINLTTEMGTGAVYLASDKLSVPLKRDYSKNFNVLYKYKKGNVCNGVCS